MPDTALVVIDLQNDYFPGGAMELEGAEAAAARASEALKNFREKKLPVIHVRHLSVRPGATFFLPGTRGAEIHASVKPLAGETVIEKGHHGLERVAHARAVQLGQDVVGEIGVEVEELESPHERQLGTPVRAIEPQRVGWQGGMDGRIHERRATGTVEVTHLAEVVLEGGTGEEVETAGQGGESWPPPRQVSGEARDGAGERRQPPAHLLDALDLRAGGSQRRSRRRRRRKRPPSCPAPPPPR
jgi:hypothetical protein